MNKITEQVDELIGKDYNRAELRRILRQLGKQNGIKLWYMWQVFTTRTIILSKKGKISNGR